MDALTVVVVIALAGGLALLVLGPVLLALAVSSGRERRWVSRHAVVPCAALRPGSRLPRRLAVYGATVPGPGGLVVAPLSGVEAVWFRTMACSTVSVGDPSLTTTRILWQQSGGEPFGVADGTGTVAVSATMLQWSTYMRHMSGKARSRHSVGRDGPSPVRILVEEDTTSHRRHGPWLQRLIDNGLVRADAAKDADQVTVIEEIVPPGIPLHVIGRPAIRDGGVVALTLPMTGRYLVLSREPADTEAALRADRRSGTGCAVQAILVGAAFVAVGLAINYAMTR